MTTKTEDFTTPDKIAKFDSSDHGRCWDCMNEPKLPSGGYSAATGLGWLPFMKQSTKNGWVPMCDRHQAMLLKGTHPMLDDVEA